MTDATTLSPFPYSYPAFFRGWRKHQEEAVDAIVEAYERGVRLVFLDAPPGSGKTWIAEAVRQRLKTSSIYCATTKSLMDQVAGDFPDAKVIKGKGNYATLDFPNDWPDISCEDCTYRKGKGCQYCGEVWACPYRVAKKVAVRSPSVLSNTAYLLSECNHQGRLSGRGLVVCDEADQLADQIGNFVSIEIGEKRRVRYGIDAPDKVTVASSWVEWAQETRERLTAVLDAMDVDGEAGETGEEDVEDEAAGASQDYSPGGNGTVGGGESSGPVSLFLEAGEWTEAPVPSPFAREQGPAPSRPIPSSSPSLPSAPSTTREEKWLVSTINKLQLLIDTADNWAYTGDERKVVFQPVHVAELGKEYLWRHGDRWLLMSGTILDPQQRADDLGWEGEYYYHQIPSVFPANKRPVFVWPVVNMTYGNKDAEDGWAGLVKAVESIARRYKGQRVLVHSVSYALTTYLRENLSTDRRVIYYQNARGRDYALKQFRQSRDGILLAPSLDRGISLDYDQCRVQIICKLPYLSIGDRRVSRRLYGEGQRGKRWYDMECLATLIQMCGRVVRAEDDEGDTWLVDSSFSSKLWPANFNRVPKWWVEGLVWMRP